MFYLFFLSFFFPSSFLSSFLSLFLLVCFYFSLPSFVSLFLFSRVNATLDVTLSVCRLVGRVTLMVPTKEPKLRREKENEKKTKEHRRRGVKGASTRATEAVSDQSN